MNEIWVFGYGSIMWNPGFRYERKRTCFLKGWERRFWQESSDHRGTLSMPGRVATIIRKKNNRCWGVAYNVAKLDANEVLQKLDARERNGYERMETVATSCLGYSFECLTYVAKPNNPYYSEEDSLHSIAKQAALAKGPSGANREYIMLIIQELRRLGVYERHAEAIWKILKDGTESCQR
ncbi:gamma-glutamylcyclotransferase [Gammaproteobacteria bacterium]|nr:gamma-glutamylcyclotransferase [Gammaproteobacteria bacterium]